MGQRWPKRRVYGKRLKDSPTLCQVELRDTKADGEATQHIELGGSAAVMTVSPTATTIHTDDAHARNILTQVLLDSLVVL